MYNLNDDFNERTDLAKKYPEKLKELRGLFDVTAKKYNIYPLIDWADVWKRRSQVAKQAAATNVKEGNAAKK